MTQGSFLVGTFDLAPKIFDRMEAEPLAFIAGSMP
jgi:hypothetical protein